MTDRVPDRLERLFGVLLRLSAGERLLVSLGLSRASGRVAREFPFAHWWSAGAAHCCSWVSVLSCLW